MKWNDDIRQLTKNVRERFFADFAVFHIRWMRKLVEKYKERGIYPVFPTQIAEYYSSPKDKETAIMSALCMDWDNGREIEQISSMRRILGEHPYEWFVNREFVSLSIPREQDNHIDGCAFCRYWRIAKLYDMLYVACKRKDGKLRSFSEVFSKGDAFADFCDKYADTCGYIGIRYPRMVIELVLRSSDGIGRRLWPTTPRRIKCPVRDKIRGFLGSWFPDYYTKYWPFAEAVTLFRLEHDYDFFYAYLAWQDLCEVDPLACKQYLVRYQSRYKRGVVLENFYWRKERSRQPIIQFDK